MRPRDLLDLVILAALWGGSYLFMRISGPEFGPIALVQVRVSLAAAVLLVLLGVRGGLATLRQRTGHLVAVGVLNSALPFCLLTFGTLFVTGGFAAIVNATTPMWTAIVGWLWLRDRIRPMQAMGLLLGFAGVAVLLWGRVDLRPGGSQWQVTVAVTALLFAAAAYGIAAVYVKRHLAGLPSLTVAAGSQVGASLALLPLAFFAWPAQSPSGGAWAGVIALAVACTALAYVLYFRLLARIGAVRSAAVTFLVPVFANAWGAAFLGEAITLQMLVGGAVILTGTALALGLVGASKGADRSAPPKTASAAPR